MPTADRPRDIGCVDDLRSTIQQFPQSRIIRALQQHGSSKVTIHVSTSELGLVTCLTSTSFKKVNTFVQVLFPPTWWHADHHNRPYILYCYSNKLKGTSPYIQEKGRDLSHEFLSSCGQRKWPWFIYSISSCIRATGHLWLLSKTSLLTWCIST